jgi:hypothetical protein
MNPLLTFGLPAASILLGFESRDDHAERAAAQVAIAQQRGKKPQNPKTGAKPSGGGSNTTDTTRVPTSTVTFGDGSEGSFEVDEKVVKAVERGLKWLADQQQPNGSWIANVGFKLNEGYRINEEGQDRGHVGVTALAGMAFLANGHVPGRGRYGSVIDKAIDYVLSCQQGNGYISANGSRMYSHAFGTLFLAEALGMAKRDDLREKLEDSIRLIVDSQNQEGGWRYVPFAKESDMSITVCQVMALRAARNAGIPVPRATIDRAVAYVKASAVKDPGTRRGFADDERGAFRYQSQNYSRATFPLTAAGVVTLYGAGVYNDRDIEDGLDFLERNLVEFSEQYGSNSGNYGGHYFFYYGNYYAVQAMYTAGPPRWTKYYDHIREVLLRMQESDGKWPNRVGPGEAFGTAVATLILEIPYRFLPIFQR